MRTVATTAPSRDIPALGTDDELLTQAQRRLRASLSEKEYFSGDNVSQRASQTFMELKDMWVGWPGAELAA